MLASLQIPPLSYQAKIYKMQLHIIKNVIMTYFRLWQLLLEVEHNVVGFQIVENKATIVNYLEDIQYWMSKMQNTRIW